MIQLLPIVLVTASLIVGQHRPDLAVQPQPQGTVLAVLGDSTSDAQDEWVYRVGTRIAQRYPMSRVTYRLYDCSVHAWSAPTIIRDGASEVTIYNASCSGWSAAKFTREIAERGALFPATPDLLLVSLGHNPMRASGDAYGPELRGLLAVLPKGHTALVTQNPQRPDRPGYYDALQLERMDQVRETATDLGLGLIDVEDMFLQRIAIGDWSWIGTADNVHPNAIGEDLWARRVAWELARPAAQSLPGWCSGDPAHPRW